MGGTGFCGRGYHVDAFSPVLGVARSAVRKPRHEDRRILFNQVYFTDTQRKVGKEMLIVFVCGRRR